MSAFPYVERSIQDTANVANTTGVTAIGLVQSLHSYLPGPTIERGRGNLRRTVQCLQAEAHMPEILEKKYYKDHDRLFDAGIKLTKEGKRTILNPFKFSDYRSRAQEFENVTEGLRDEVTQTSDYYRARNGRRYPPSVHTVESTWEEMAALSSDDLAEPEANTADVFEISAASPAQQQDEEPDSPVMIEEADNAIPLPRLPQSRILTPESATESRTSLTVI